MKKWQRVVAGTSLFGVLVMAFFAFSVPFFASMLVDYGHPHSVGWSQDDAGKRTLQIVYNDKAGFALPHLYAFIGSTIQPLLWQLILLSYVLAVLYCLGARRLFYLKIDDPEEMALLWGPVLVGMILCLLGWVAAAGLNESYFDVRNTLRSAISDKELADAASGYYTDVQWGIGLLLLLSFVLMGIVVLVSWVAIEALSEREDDLRLNVTRNSLRELGLENGALILRQGGSMEFVRGEIVIQRKKFRKHLVLEKFLSHRISFDHFFHLLVHVSKEAAFKELQEKLRASFWERYQGVGKIASSRLLSLIAPKLQAEVVEEVRLFQKQGRGVFAGDAEKLLQQVSDAMLSRFQQDVVTGATEEAINSALGDFDSRIVESVRQQVAEHEKQFFAVDTLPVLLDGTKVYVRRGDTVFLVVEEKPQLRTINLYRIKEAHLAFPYTIFAMKFWKGRFNCLNVFYRTKPLQSIDDQIFQVNLPNCSQHDGSVCMGSFHWPQEDRVIADQVQAVIAHFWQSHFAEYGSNLAPDDPRLKSVKHWEAASAKDPLFPLAVRWQPAGITLRSIAESKLEGSRGFDEIVQEAVNHVLAVEKKNIGEVVQRFCSKISSTNRYGKKIREKLASYLDEMAVKLGEKALPRLQRSLQMQNKEDLQRFDLIVTEVLGEVLAQDFKQLQSEVLLRRTIEPDTLLGRIREGR